MKTTQERDGFFRSVFVSRERINTRQEKRKRIDVIICNCLLFIIIALDLKDIRRYVL
jgi:hypothetical protein